MILCKEFEYMKCFLLSTNKSNFVRFHPASPWIFSSFGSCFKKKSNRRSWAVFLIFVFPWENVVFWYVDITKSMCGWPPGTRSTGFFPEAFRQVSTPLKNTSQIGNHPQIGVKMKHIWNHHLVFCWGGPLWRATTQKSSGRWEDGRFFLSIFSWTLNIWIWIKLFCTLLNDNWIGILKHVGYSIKKFCNKRSITILCQQIFQKVASPQTGTHLGQDPIPVDTRWGNPILQKTPVKKSHGYFSTKRTSRFPRLKKHSEKPWIRGF